MALRLPSVHFTNVLRRWELATSKYLQAFIKQSVKNKTPYF
jgi:hypothetical protein